MSRLDELQEYLEAATPDAEPVAEEAEAPSLQPSAERRVLTNHQARSATTVHGKGAFLFGIPFFGAGVFIVLCSLDVIPTDDSSFNVSRELVALIGGVCFGAPGLWLMFHGLRGIVRGTVHRNRLTQHPDQPWRADHQWDERGETRSGWRGVRSNTRGLLIFGGFLTPFHWLALTEPDASFLWFGLVFFDLIVFAILCHTVLRGVRAMKYGASRLSYDWFPFHTGESVSLRLGMSRPREFDVLRLTLRAVEEAYETRGSGENRSERVVAYGVYEDVRELTGDAAHLSPGREAAVEFEIPDDAPSSDLATRPPRYWELDVRGEIRGADFCEVFLVPVYAKPR